MVSATAATEHKLQESISLLDMLKKQGWQHRTTRATLADYVDMARRLVTCSLSEDIGPLEKAIHASDSCMHRADQTGTLNRAFYERCAKDTETAYLVVSAQRRPLGYGRFFIMLSRERKRVPYSSVALFMDHIQVPIGQSQDLEISLCLTGILFGRKLGMDHIYMPYDASPFGHNSVATVYLRKRTGIAHLKRGLPDQYYQKPMACVDLYDTVR